MYAEDHQIYTNDNDIQQAAHTLRRPLTEASQWYKENLLQTSPQKYQILTIDPQLPGKLLGMHLRWNSMDKVKSSNYLNILGVIAN